MNLNTIINIVIFKTSPCFDVSISLFQNFIISIIIEPINLMNKDIKNNGFQEAQEGEVENIIV